MNLAPKRALALVTLACVLAIAQTEIASPARQKRLDKHALLFGEYDSNQRLESVRPNPAGVIDLSQNMRHFYSVPPGIQTPEDELALAANYADAVVEGAAVRRYSALTAHHSFVFSDWTVTVTRVFKNSSSIQVPVGTEITVTRPGGNTVVSGRQVTAQDKSFPDFITGHQYVLYLRALPETSSFQAMSHALFDVSGRTPIPLLDPEWRSTTLRAFGPSVSVPAFLTTIERSIQR